MLSVLPASSARLVDFAPSFEFFANSFEQQPKRDSCIETRYGIATGEIVFLKGNLVCSR